MLFQTKKESEFYKNVLTLMSGTLIAQALPFFTSPILSRIYSPENFGVYGLFTSIVGVTAVLATGRYELAIMLPKKETDARTIVKISCLFAVFVGALAFLTKSNSELLFFPFRHL